jgi:hypothetical protein
MTTLYCAVSSSAPATTNVVMGFVGVNDYNIDLTTAPEETVKIVNDFISVIGKHVLVDVLDCNVTDIFEINIIIPGETDLEQITIEYPSLTAAKKKKVDAMINLVLSTITPTNN